MAGSLLLKEPPAVCGEGLVSWVCELGRARSREVKGERGKWSTPSQCLFRFGCVGEGSIQERWCLPVGYTEGGLNTGIMEAILKP